MKPIHKEILTSFVVVIIINVVVLIGYFLYLEIQEKIQHKKYMQAHQWMINGIDNCVIASKNKPLEVFKIVLQKNIYFNQPNKTTFYDADGREYSAKIDVDAISGLAYKATLENKNEIWLTFDFKDNTCNVLSFTPQGEIVYDKHGYLGISLKLNDLGDWKMFKDIQETLRHKKNKKINFIQTQ